MTEKSRCSIVAHSRLEEIEPPKKILSQKEFKAAPILHLLLNIAKFMDKMGLEVIS
jgi:biotin synthase-related radical SAM superfamily protein